MSILSSIFGFLSSEYDKKAEHILRYQDLTDDELKKIIIESKDESLIIKPTPADRNIAQVVLKNR